jgi:hypothetical protein
MSIMSVQVKPDVPWGFQEDWSIVKVNVTFEDPPWSLSSPTNWPPDKVCIRLVVNTGFQGMDNEYSSLPWETGTEKRNVRTFEFQEQFLSRVLTTQRWNGDGTTYVTKTPCHFEVIVMKGEAELFRASTGAIELRPDV